MASIVELFDAKGRPYHLPLLNESEDGSGEWHIPKCNSDGEALVREHGGAVTPAHTAFNVTTTSAMVLAANDDRVYGLFLNDSDTTIYLYMGGEAAVNTGIRLNANGGSYEMSKKQGNLYTGLVKAIHAGTGNKVLLITEGEDA